MSSEGSFKRLLVGATAKGSDRITLPCGLDAWDELADSDGDLLLLWHVERAPQHSLIVTRVLGPR